MNPSRDLTRAAAWRGSAPKRRICPPEGRSSIARSRSSVVLPAPLGPKIVRNSPARTSMLARSRPTWCPKRRDRSRVETTDSCVAGCAPGSPSVMRRGLCVHLFVDLHRLARQLRLRPLEILPRQLADGELHLEILEILERLLAPRQQI